VESNEIEKIEKIEKRRSRREEKRREEKRREEKDRNQSLSFQSRKGRGESRGNTRVPWHERSKKDVDTRKREQGDCV